MVNYKLLLWAGIFICFLSSFPAQSAPTATTRDDIARLQIDHLKEIVSILEQKNKQLREAEINANEQRFKAQEQAVAFALASAEKAVTKAELAAEKRFESVNEFRNQLKDQTGTFLTRNEMWGWLVALIMMGFSAWSILRRQNADKHLP